MKVVIIGNSAAAVGCIEGLRAAGSKAEITVISDENYPVYSRPLISYYLYGKVQKEKMGYRDADFYEKNAVTLIKGTKAEAIDTKAKTVAAGGKKYPYDKLLIATGSVPFYPQIEGMNEKNTQTFLKRDDAEAIKALIKPETRVVIAGAGLIGLKAAEGLAPHCARITVIELANRVMPTILDEKAASYLQKALEEKGVEIILDDSITKVSGVDYVTGITTKSGREVPCDLFVLAVGVRPNVKLAQDIGVKTGRGIIVDETCRTNVENIYAAGDVTESRDAVSGEIKIMALWPNAYAQGETAGMHMTGSNCTCPPLFPMNAVTFFGYPVITAGILDANTSTVYEREDGNGFARLYIREHNLTGVALFGNAVDRAGLFTTLIREKTPIQSPEELLGPKFGLKWYDKATRMEKLAK